MLVLGIDTATAIASVGIASPAGPVVERTLGVKGNHARTTLPLIDEVLTAASMRLKDLRRIAVSIGPGSFTGLRIGLSVAKGLGMATGLPVVGVATLDAYARAAGQRQGTVIAVLDARKGEVYAAGYRWRDSELVRTFGPIAVIPALLIERLAAPCTLIGDGVDAYEALWRSVPAVVEALRLSERPPSGAAVAALGARGDAEPLELLEPIYCRAAEAEVHLERRLASLSTG